MAGARLSFFPSCRRQGRSMFSGPAPRVKARHGRCQTAVRRQSFSWGLLVPLAAVLAQSAVGGHGRPIETGLRFVRPYAG